MRLKGGFFDGREVQPPAGWSVVLPVVENCGRACGPHFSSWHYDTRTGEYRHAETYIGDLKDPDTRPHRGDWPTGRAAFTENAPVGYLDLSNH